MMAPQAAKPIAATRFANLMCWIGSVQSGALLRRSNDSLVYPRNKNGMPWLPWRRPGDKRSALQLLDCPKAKQSSAIALTKSARWNQLSALKREQLYRRSSKIQFALWWLSGVSACWRVGVSCVLVWTRIVSHLGIFRRGLTIHRSAWSIILTICPMILSQASSSRANVSAEIYR
jgi:hypothetical protein